MSYQIAHPVVVERARLDGEGPATTKVRFEPKAGAQSFATRRQAACTYMRALDPDLAAASDEFVMSHWHVWQRQGYAKVVKVP